MEPKIHYCTHKSLPPVCILGQINQVHAFPPSHFLQTYFNIILPPMSVSSKWSHSLRFSHQNPVCTSPCPTHCILLDLISQIIFSQKYRSLSPSLCNLHSPVTSYSPRPIHPPHILFSTLFSNTLTCVLP